MCALHGLTTDEQLWSDHKEEFRAPEVARAWQVVLEQIESDLLSWAGSPRATVFRPRVSASSPRRSASDARACARRCASRSRGSWD